MAYCKKCGTKLDEDAVFCPNCGTPVTRPEKKERRTQNAERRTSSGTVLNTGNLYGRLNLEKLPKGHLIDDRYEIIRKLGQGSFGAVYLAYDRKMEMQKVLKVIPEVISNDKKAMVLLRKEASIMAKLNHKNIVRVYDFHDNGDINFIDMEYVEGQSLADLLLKTPENKLPEEEVKNYALQIAEGLAYAHNQRVIHKDIKPQNIMLTQDGTIKLMDFGIAETVHSSMSRLKNTGSSGTLVYMSPEQLRGKDVGKESDIYSLGATLYELLTGNPPFYQGDITYQIINEAPKPITGVSQQMNGVVLKCLEKDLRERFKNCKELSDALKNPEKLLKNKTVEIKEQHEYATNRSHDISGNTGRKKGHSWIHWTIFLFLIAAGIASYFLLFAPSRKAKQISKTGSAEITKPMIKDSTAILSTEKNAQSKSNKKVATVNKTPATEEKLTANKEMVQTAFVSIPSGTDIFVDGQSQGKTPLKINLKKGPHKIRLKKTLYYDTLISLNINKSDKFLFKLKKKAKWVSIKSKPSGAKLYINGQYQGITPVRFIMNFGKYKIKLIKGNQSVIRNLLFLEESLSQLNFKLKEFLNFTDTTDNLDIKMIAVKGGSFKMGRNFENDDESPVHIVTLKKFFIGQYEVTQRQWKKVMGSNPSYFKGDNLPVENVSWNDVQKFLRKLNRITDKHYRLPTEAEWEYAARGGNKSKGYTYSGSDNPDQVAWYWQNSGNKILSGDWSSDKVNNNNGKTHPVGLKQANELGIYDMSGNVWEWCSDWYGENYYKDSPRLNPQGPKKGYSRVCRGGSWYYNANYCKIANRLKNYPNYQSNCLGFRLALSYD